MTRRVVAALLLGLASLAACRDGQAAANQASASAERPEIHLLTSLPLLFGEQFGLNQSRPAVTAALEGRYRLKAVDVASALPPGGTLLAVQPRALPAEELVKLDQWVREGGRLVLLADPMLEWHSERPLGDSLRPPVMYGDTGLLQHWGLRLDAPDERGPVRLGGSHFPIVYISPGRLVIQSGNCEASRANVVVECQIEKGRVAVVADADWLNADLVKATGGRLENQFSELIEIIESVRRPS